MNKRIGLDIRDDGWTIAEISGNKELNISALISGKWEPGTSIPSKAASLKQAFSNHQIPSKNLVVSVPMNEGYWKQIILPSLLSREVDQIIENTLVADLPQPPSSFCYGYKKRSHGSKQLLAEGFVIPKRIIMETTELLQEAGLKASCYLPDLYSLIKGFTFLAGENLSTSAAMFIIVHHLYLEIGIYESNLLKYYRSIPLLIANEKIEQQVVMEELRLTKFMLRKEGCNLPDFCYLLPGTGLWKKEELLELTTLTLGFERHKIRTPSDFGLPLRFYKEKEIVALSSLTAVGLALEVRRAASNSIRLTMEDNREKKFKGKINLILLVLGILMALIGIRLNFRLEHKERQDLIGKIVGHEEKVREVENLIDMDESLTKQALFYQQEWEKTRSILKFFAVWEETVPKETILTSVVFDKDQIKQITGRCRSFSELYQALLNCAYFTQLQVKGEITINRDGYESFYLAGKWNNEYEVTN